MELTDIKICLDFENLIPKQTAEQFKQLEENMVSEGRARNPLVLWRGKNILVDGHHRLRILKAHPELKWSVIEQDFADEDEVREWIIKNALGTRNLTEMQQTELTGRLHLMRKNKRGGDRKSKCKNNTLIPGDTAEQVARELGINRTTVYNASRFVEGLDKAESAVPGFKDDVLTGAIKAQKQEIAAMRKQTPEQIKQTVAEIKDRKSAKRKSADKDLFKKIREITAEMQSVSTTQYGLAELIREVDALGDSFILSLTSMIKRRQNVMDSYDDSTEEISSRIDAIIEKLNDVKKGIEK